MSTIIEDSQAFEDKYFYDIKTDKKYLSFRMTMLSEEFHETLTALLTDNAEEYVDGNIDIIKIALGNLQHAGVDVQKAWDQVHNANMTKVRGVKPGREGSDGKDVYKLPNWVAPDHKDNHGVLDDIFQS